MNSNLNVSGNTTLQGNSTILANLNISGNTTIQGNHTILANLNISGNSTLQGSTTLLANLNISGVTTLQGNTTILQNFNVSGNSLLEGNLTLKSNLFILGLSTLTGSLNIKSTNLPLIDAEIHNINWTNYNTSFATAELIGGNINAQTVTLSSTNYVYKQYTTSHPNKPHLLTMYVKFDNSNVVTNIALSAYSFNGWNTSNGRIFTQLDGINSNNYIQISWIFIPPVTLSNPNTFNLNIGYHSVPNLTQQQSTIIRYYNLQIKPIDGNLNMEGSANLMANLNVNGDSLLNGRALINSDLFILILSNKSLLKKLDKAEEVTFTPF